MIQLGQIWSNGKEIFVVTDRMQEDTVLLWGVTEINLLRLEKDGVSEISLKDLEDFLNDQTPNYQLDLLE